MKGFKIGILEKCKSLNTTLEELMEDKLLDMTASKPEPREGREETVPENKLTLDILAKGFQIFKMAFEFFHVMNPYDTDTKTKANSRRRVSTI